MKTLDVMALPPDVVYTSSEYGGSVRPVDIVLKLKESVKQLAKRRLVKCETDSLGFAFATLQWEGDEGPEAHWDEPEKFIWFVTGWGDSKITLIANAVRKLRPLLRSIELAESSLDIKTFDPGDFKDVVDSVEEDGSYAWGDFPWGGAVVVQIGQLIVYCAVSGATEVEDHAIAHLAATLVAENVLYLEQLLP